MAYGRVRLTDPAPGGLGFYDFQVNYNSEEEVGKERSIERTANTGMTGAVRQQGDDGPLIFRFTGTILHKAQHQALRNFYEASKSRTIIFRDFEGEEHEVLITAYKAKRKAVVHNSKDVANARLHIYEYTMSLDVIRTISGVWA